jgi:DNA-binding NarL/FixJ family response regulator
MGPRRVFVLWRHPLFYESIRLLLRDPAVALVGATSDPSGAFEQLVTLHPDVVIMEKVRSEPEQGPDPAGLLGTGARLLSLNLSDNQLSVYSRVDHMVADAQDLLTLILEEPPRSSPGGPDP